MTHYVYVASCGPYVKIGRAKNVKSRLSQIQTGNPRLVKLEHTFTFNCEDAAHSGEYFIHDALRRNRIRGEWFKTTPQRAIRAGTSALCSHLLWTRDGFAHGCKWRPDAIVGFVNDIGRALSEEPEMLHPWRMPRWDTLNRLAKQEARIAWVAVLARRLLKHGVLLERFSNGTTDQFNVVLPIRVPRGHHSLNFANNVARQLFRIAGSYPYRIRSVDDVRDETFLEEVAALIRAADVESFLPKSWFESYLCRQGGNAVWLRPSDGSIRALADAWSDDICAEAVAAIGTGIDG